MHGQMFTHAETAPGRKGAAYSSAAHYTGAASAIATTYRLATTHAASSSDPCPASAITACYSLAAAKPVTLAFVRSSAALQGH
jgi:hypothetical protein